MGEILNAAANVCQLWLSTADSYESLTNGGRDYGCKCLPLVQWLALHVSYTTLPSRPSEAALSHGVDGQMAALNIRSSGILPAVVCSHLENE